jgi:tRNA-dihydrouridine synthase B
MYSEYGHCAVFAPMAGFSDKIMRSIADSFSAAATTTEMVSARALSYGDKKSLTLMETLPHNGDYGIQLFGFCPDDFRVATKIALKYSPDFIDINMGCPAPKITSSGSGSALMKTPDLAGKIAKACVERSNGVPVTAKIRMGWDDKSINYLELSHILEYSGISAITLHRRTRNQMYSGKIDINAIKNLKSSVDIPVIGNGDILNADDAIYMMNYTGCNAVMVGRCALSKPWIFKQIDQILHGKKPMEEPSAEEVVDLMLHHAKALCEENGEYMGIRKARSQCALYIKGFRNAAKFRSLTNSLNTYDDIKKLAEAVLNETSARR